MYSILVENIIFTIRRLSNFNAIHMQLYMDLFSLNRHEEFIPNNACWIQVYVAAGKAFQLEADISSVEEQIKRTDETTSARTLKQLHDDVIQISVEVDKSAKQVRVSRWAVVDEHGEHVHVMYVHSAAIIFRARDTNRMRMCVYSWMSCRRR